MNRADFDTQPEGFPLESDATLGFMQTSYTDAVNALAKLAAGDLVIITGMEETGNNVADGWCLINNELIFFEGGTKSDFVIIEQSVTQKANENGTLVDRYFDRKARFGTAATQYSYSSFKRVNRLDDIGTLFQSVANQGVGSVFTILSGLTPVNGGTNGISSGAVMHRGLRIIVPAYNLAVNSGSPVYLYKDGTWNTSSSNDEELIFDPYPLDRVSPSLPVVFAAKSRDSAYKVGGVIWVKTTELETDFFDGTGLGDYEWKGWALANGNNGTIDLSTAITGLTAIERIS